MIRKKNTKRTYHHELTTHKHHPLLLKFSRFRCTGKSKKRILDRGFLPSDVAKVLKIFNSQKGSSLFFSKDKNDNADALRYSFLKRQNKRACEYKDSEKEEIVFPYFS